MAGNPAFAFPPALSNTQRGYHTFTLYIYRTAFPSWDILRQYAQEMVGDKKSMSKAICVAMMVLADIMKIPQDQLSPNIRESLQKAEEALGVTF